MIKQIAAIQVHVKASTVVLVEIWRGEFAMPIKVIKCGAENVHARAGKHSLQQEKTTNANIRQRNDDVNNVYVLNPFAYRFWHIEI